MEDFTTFRTAAYYRLSKEDAKEENEESNSIQTQKKLIAGYIERHPEFLLTMEICDDGYSGLHMDRPGIKKLWEAICGGRIDCVIVKDLSRLGRNYIQTGTWLEKIFPSLGIRFVAVNDGYDSFFCDDFYKDLMLPFKNILNDAYSRDISEKVKSHLKAKRENGEFVNPFPRYGFVRNPASKSDLLADEKAAAIVREIFRRKLEGEGIRKIADDLNLKDVPSPLAWKRKNGCRLKTSFDKRGTPRWTPGAVRRILTDELYTGILIQGKSVSGSLKIKKRFSVPEEKWSRTEGKVEPFINRWDFEAVQRELKMDTRKAPGTEKCYLFSGFCICKDCQQAMVRRVVGKQAFLICSGRKDKKGCVSWHRLPEEQLREGLQMLLILYGILAQTPYTVKLNRRSLLLLVEKIEVEEGKRVCIVFRFGKIRA